MPGKPKVGIVSSAPAPYRIPFFERLGKRSDLELKVIFLSKVCGPFDWHTDFECEFPHLYLELPQWQKYKNYPQWIHPDLPGILRKEKFDVLIMGGYFLVSLIYVPLWCLKRGTPYMFWMESHDRGLETPLVRRVIKRAFIQPLVRRAKAHIAVGSYARDRLTKWGIDPEHVAIILNSPDVDLWVRETDKHAMRREDIRKKLGLEPGPVLLFVGRMVPEKGVEDLLDAYNEAIRDGSAEGLQLLMVGEGPLLELLKDRSRRFGLDGVRFAGFVAPEELYPYYAASDAFVLPSRYEPYGVVIHEAASARLPLIVSDCCGATAELVQDGENGFVFHGGDTKGLAEAIRKMYRCDNEWKRMGEKSRNLARMYDYSHGEEQFMKAIRISMSEVL